MYSAPPARSSVRCDACGQRHARAEGAFELGAAVGDQVVAGIGDVAAASARRRRRRRWRRAPPCPPRPGDLDLGPVERRASSSTAFLYRLRVAKSISAKRLRLRSTSSTSPTLSTNSAQSNHVIRRMLVITLRTVTFIVAMRWCSSWTSSSAVVPCEASSRSSSRSAGVTAGSWSRSRWKSWTRAGRRELRARQPAQRRGGVVRIVAAETEQAVGELVGGLAVGPAAHDPFGESAQVLDVQDAQADGDRPELADGQRLHLLVGVDHPPQAVGIEPAVGVGDVRPRQPEHPRVAVEMAAGQLRELAVVVAREVVADLAELLVDDREVVDEPLGGRRDRAFVLDRLRQHPIRLDQHATVVGDAGRIAMPRSVRAVARVWAAASVRGVLFQAFDAEQFGDDRLLDVRFRVAVAPACRRDGERTAGSSSPRQPHRPKSRSDRAREPSTAARSPPDRTSFTSAAVPSAEIAKLAIGGEQHARRNLLMSPQFGPLPLSVKHTATRGGRQRTHLAISVVVVVVVVASQAESNGSLLAGIHDRVPGQPEMTEFRRVVRYHNAMWREANGYPIGTHRNRPGTPPRLVGSRLDLDFGARESGANFLTTNAVAAARARTSFVEPHQMFDHQGFWADLLSSEALAVNLFGDLAADLDRADRAVHTWWPEAPGRVTDVRFAHSPGRFDPSYSNSLRGCSTRSSSSPSPTGPRESWRSTSSTAV